MQIANPRPVLVGFPETAPSVPIEGRLTLRLLPSCTRMMFSQIHVSLVQNTRVKSTSASVMKDFLKKGCKVGLKPAASHVTVEDEIGVMVEELARWSVPESTCVASLDRDAERQVGFEFILQIPGHVPATTYTSIGSVEHFLIATAVVGAGRVFKTSTKIRIQRVVPCPSNDLGICFLRCCPDMKLTSNLTVPVIINPIGSFPVQTILHGTVVRGEQTTLCHRVDECRWRIDEIVRIISVSSQGPRSVSHIQESKHRVRKLAGGKCRRKWADHGDAQIKIDFEIVLPPKARTTCDAQPCLDLHGEISLRNAGSSQDFPYSRKIGISVSHVLVLELVMVEDIYEKETGKRMNLDPWRKFMYGATYNLHIAQRILGGCVGQAESDENESLPTYSDSSRWGPPAYELPK
ncbi:MAG: hypothetical protein M1834_007031 [Cirrosporium novae-zelandiae]|nr:MAG: hypothetical protein M1834_007031 [Cirrosporium novae-zelandiae]